jgi:hypothetical protein
MVSLSNWFSFPTDDEMYRLARFRSDVEWLEERGWEYPTDDEVQQLADFRENIEWLGVENLEDVDDFERQRIAGLVVNLKWLDTYGYDNDEDAFDEAEYRFGNLQRVHAYNALTKPREAAVALAAAAFNRFWPYEHCHHD